MPTKTKKTKPAASVVEENWDERQIIDCPDLEIPADLREDLDIDGIYDLGALWEYAGNSQHAELLESIARYRAQHPDVPAPPEPEPEPVRAPAPTAKEDAWDAVVECRKHVLDRKRDYDRAKEELKEKKDLLTNAQEHLLALIGDRELEISDPQQCLFS